MQIDEIAEPVNASLSIHDSFESGSNVIVDRVWHPPKQVEQSRSTEAGIQTDESNGQLPNALSSIQESFEPDSKVTLDRDRHRLKHHLPSRSTEEGMQIDVSEQL
jgi:hypothetical protein